MTVGTVLKLFSALHTGTEIYKGFVGIVYLPSGDVDSDSFES
jgi:hypothetical protein